MKLCKCGCGKIVRKGNRFINGHNSKYKRTINTKMKMSLNHADFNGKNNPRWNGGRIKSTDGYIKIYKPEHPRADNGGYVYEHILIMEKKIGRYLKDKENI